MSNPIIYQVDFRPLDVFFFGGEQHFGEGDDANYFVRSNFFPQQSGVLGMLRHQLLIQNDCIPVKGKEVEASKLIGSESYDINGSTKEFGSIKNISPIFITTENGILFPEAFEYYIHEKKDPDNLSQIEVSLIDKAAKTLLYPRNENPSIISAGNDYLGKFEIMELLVAKSGARYNYCHDKYFIKKGTLPENGMFLETGKPGIQKALRKQKGAKDQGFYKQYSYSFPKKTCFTFFVEIDRSIATNFASGRIMLGGEKSPFEMIVEEFKGKESPFNEESGFYNGLYKANSSLNKIVCISDCIAKDNLAEDVTFMSNPMIDFRNSRTKVAQTSNYYKMHTRYESPQSKYDLPVRSNKYQLLKRGSVLWVTDDQLEFVSKHIKKDQHRVIGYNYIKIIKHS